MQSTTQSEIMPCKPLVKVRKRDNHALNLLTAQIFMEKSLLFRKRYNMRYASFQDLFHVYRHYKDSNTGIKSFALVHLVNSSDGGYRALGDRLSLLRSKGLLVLLDGLYYPTELAIEEFGKLLS